MARKGRDLEILIEKLEKAVLPVEAKIKSPGFVIDRVTGQNREVDIVIEYTIGTTPIKIAIECRDRHSTQDTTWIEQALGKLNDLNANKKILVSSSDFGEPAKVKAKFYGIETRSLNEVDKKLIESWCQIEYMDFNSNQFTIVGVTFKMDDSDFLNNFETTRNGKDKFIKSDEGDDLININSIFQAISEQIPDWKTMKPNEPPIRKHITVKYSNPNSRFYLEKDNKKSYITEIEFIADLRILEQKVPISKVSSYKDDSRTISEIIEFDGVPLQGHEVFQMIRNQDGSISISTRKK